MPSANSRSASDRLRPSPRDRSRDRFVSAVYSGPEMIGEGVDLALTGEHLERGEAEIVDRCHRPAVVAIRVDEPIGHCTTLSRTVEQAPDVGPASEGGFEFRNFGGECGCRGGADRR